MTIFQNFLYQGAGLVRYNKGQPKNYLVQKRDLERVCLSRLYLWKLFTLWKLLKPLTAFLTVLAKSTTWLSMVKIFESRLMRCILLTSRQWQFFKNIQVLKRFLPQSDAPKFSAGPAENFGAVLDVLIKTILRPNIHDWNILRTYFYKYLFIQSHYQPISIHPTNISIFPLRAVKLKHLGQGSCQGPLHGKL